MQLLQHGGVGVLVTESCLLRSPDDLSMKNLIAN